jgi:hypothetical protein
LRQNPFTLQYQMNFIRYEFQNKENDAYKRLRSNQVRVRRDAGVPSKYERCGTHAACHQDRRLGFAAQVWKYYR